MRFYNIKIKSNEVKGKSKNINKKEVEVFNEMLLDAACDVSKMKAHSIGCAYLLNNKPIEYNVVLKNNDWSISEFASCIYEKLEGQLNVFSFKEITSSDYSEGIYKAEKKEFVYDYHTFIESNKLGFLLSRTARRGNYDEVVVDVEENDEKIISSAKDKIVSKDFNEELVRISKSKVLKKQLPHPVQYVFEYNNSELANNASEDLIKILYNKNRLISTRYCKINPEVCVGSKKELEDIYIMNDGGCIVMNLGSRDEAPLFRLAGNINLEEVCEVVKKYNSKVLTIFVLDDVNSEYKRRFRELLENVGLVFFKDDTYFKDSALEIFKMLADKDKIELTKKIKNRLLNSEAIYTYDEVLDLYNMYKKEMISLKYFPEYIPFVQTKNVQNEEEEIDSIKELDEMVGLVKAKSVIKNAINFFTLRKEYENRGIDLERPSMHMVFTGNPGTAKTTVARLLARILNEKEILSEGKLVELGRADLVGKYVGHTAPNVVNAFNRAEGSVLFIDEAYSLCDGDKNLFGAEAINTIVQEMENRRKDMLVVFAGYKKEMNMFLKSNPGLNSRIAFHVDFDDYNEQELYEIVKLFAKKKKVQLADGVEEKVVAIFKNAVKHKDFGNGRYARNLFENAMFNQATRLVKENLTELSDEELTTLIAEDFVEIKYEETSKAIGFN